MVSICNGLYFLFLYRGIKERQFSLFCFKNATRNFKAEIFKQYCIGMKLNNTNLSNHPNANFFKNLKITSSYHQSFCQLPREPEKARRSRSEC